MNDWMKEWINDWITEWMNDWMNEWMNEWMTGWMNDWLDEWMNDRMNEWMKMMVNLKLFYWCKVEIIVKKFKFNLIGAFSSIKSFHVSVAHDTGKGVVKLSFTKDSLR